MATHGCIGNPCIICKPKYWKVTIEVSGGSTVIGSDEAPKLRAQLIDKKHGDKLSVDEERILDQLNAAIREYRQAFEAQVDDRPVCGGLITTCWACNGTGTVVVLGGPSHPCWACGPRLK